MARDSRGAIQVVATSADGSVRVNRQAHAGGPWRGWHSLGKPAGQAVLGGPIDWYALAVSGAVSVALLVLGRCYFRRVERGFADII